MVEALMVFARDSDILNFNEIRIKKDKDNE